MLVRNNWSPENTENFEEIEAVIGYTFSDRQLLQQALVHSSYAFEQVKAGMPDNETLEFLGDAVLDLVIGHALFLEFPELHEGELTKLRAALVKEGHLVVMARELNIGRYLFLGRGEESSGGRTKTSILASAFEALVGAIFVDGGYEAAARFTERHFAPWIARGKLILRTTDAKSRLQEVLQGQFNEAPVYILSSEDGPDHNKLFTTSVLFRGEVLGTGSAGTKKESEQQAAAAALLELKDEGDA